jgi:hypothetical protein
MTLSAPGFFGTAFRRIYKISQPQSQPLNMSTPTPTPTPLVIIINGIMMKLKPLVINLLFINLQKYLFDIFRETCFNIIEQDALMV